MRYVIWKIIIHKIHSEVILSAIFKYFSYIKCFLSGFLWKISSFLIYSFQKKFLEICQFLIMEGYIFNQVITLLSKSSSNFSKWIKYCEKVWSTLNFVDQMVLFKKYWLLFSHLTYRICSLRSLFYSTFSGAKLYVT